MHTVRVVSSVEEMAPVMARVVEPAPPKGMERLSALEREYVRGNMKPKDRTRMVKMLARDVPRAVPLRIQVLQHAALASDVRLRIFEELRTCSSDKYVQWVRKALTLPGECAPDVASGQSLPAALARVDQVMHDNFTGQPALRDAVSKMVCQLHAGGTGIPAYSMGLEGPPGVGKTHFATRVLPKALQRPVVTFQLGGASDVTYLLGNLFTYEGSKEGALAAALIETQCTNPILFFDEVDKVSNSEKGREIISCLIHLTDPTGNMAVRDRYFHGIDLDFSRCLIVLGWNDPNGVSPVLMDRINCFKFGAPTPEQRMDIALRHILPRVQARLACHLVLSTAAIAVCTATNKQGMRETERLVDHVLSCAQLHTALGHTNVCDATGCVSAAYAAARVAEAALVGGDSEASPPSGMYT